MHRRKDGWHRGGSLTCTYPHLAEALSPLGGSTCTIYNEGASVQASMSPAHSTGAQLWDRGTSDVGQVLRSMPCVRIEGLPRPDVCGRGFRVLSGRPDARPSRREHLRRHQREPRSPQKIRITERCCNGTGAKVHLPTASEAGYQALGSSSINSSPPLALSTRPSICVSSIVQVLRLPSSPASNTLRYLLVHSEAMPP